MKDFVINLLYGERLWATLIGTVSGGLIAYFFNRKLQSSKEKRNKSREEEENNKQKFRKLKTTLFALERNARYLTMSKLLLTEHARENASNMISPYLDSRAYHHELVDFIGSEEINHLYLIEYGLKEIISRIDFLNEMKKETFRTLIIANILNKDTNSLKYNHYLTAEDVVNKEILSLIDPLLIHIEVFCHDMEQYARNEFPMEDLDTQSS